MSAAANFEEVSVGLEQPASRDRVESYIVRWLVLAFLISGVIASSVQGQQLTLSGVVIDSAGMTPISGAMVTLSAMSGIQTDQSGRFEVKGLMPGTYVLTIRKVGYRFYTRQVIVSGNDSTLLIEMQQAAVSLPRVTVTPKDVTIKGLVRDSATHRPLLQASVTVFPGASVTGTLGGRFSLNRIPAGENITLVIEAIEHLPLTIELSPTKDTSIVVTLGIDSVGLRLIEQQVRRLAQRAAGIPSAVDEINRDELERSGQLELGFVLCRRLPYSACKQKPYQNVELPCVFLDDRQVPFLQVAQQPVERIARVEVFGREPKMIRAYSRSFVADLVREEALPRITYSTGLRPICF